MENNEMSFEQIIKRVNEILSALENKETPLDQSLSLFEEGVALIKRADFILDEAQKKIKMLTEDEVK
ncbi:MAG: exodeoxyribonuclease VII small subunit [Clostridia bacterium]|nr:exodeoxyribonuclease VII small subunit [Clostridia bacterium]